MERMRVQGRFVREGLDGDGGAPAKKERRPPKPSACKTFTRARVAEALPEIVGRFVEEAKKGSIAHTKLLTILGGLGDIPAEKTGRGKSTAALLLERLGEKPEKKNGRYEPV